MQTHPAQIVDHNQQPIAGSRALIWGNNAAWLCVGCGELLGNRTGDNDFAVTCQCGINYEIIRGINRSGNHNLAAATGVMRT
jgi:hypothetical protein